MNPLKKLMMSIDRRYLGSIFGKAQENKKLDYFESDLEYKITTYYTKNMTDEIAQLCDLYGSDKGEIKSQGHPYAWPSHTYADYYSQLFSHCRNSVTKVFECGLGTNNPELLSSMGIHGKPGASLRVWRDYFPNAIIYGADIDKDVLFEEERIKTFYMDQLNPKSIKEYWEIVGEDNFDFMLDDGLHTFEAGSSLFNNSIGKLSKLGTYVIEDVLFEDLCRYKDFFRNSPYAVNYIVLNRPNLPLRDNNLVVIRKA
jgi:hypothetical protein